MKVIESYKKLKVKYPEYIMLFKVKNNLFIAINDDKIKLKGALGRTYLKDDFFNHNSLTTMKKLGHFMTIEDMEYKNEK